MASLSPDPAHGESKLIRPVSGRWESLALLLATVAVIASITGYVMLRPEKVGPPKALSWQVRSFDGLNAVDQAIHSALLPAGEEIIWNNNDTGGWITLERAQKIFLPPFYRDAFWKTNGEVHWDLILPGSHLSHTESADHDKDHDKDHEGDHDAEPPAAEPGSQLTGAVAQATQGQGATVYYGSGGKIPGQSAYLLIIGHAHAGVMWNNQATIWVHHNPNAPYPDIVKPESLVGEGWRQVIPYDGASEVERVKGTQP